MIILRIIYSSFSLLLSNVLYGYTTSYQYILNDIWSPPPTDSKYKNKAAANIHVQVFLWTFS